MRKRLKVTLLLSIIAMTAFVAGIIGNGATVANAEKIGNALSVHSLSFSSRYIWGVYGEDYSTDQKHINALNDRVKSIRAGLSGERSDAKLKIILETGTNGDYVWDCNNTDACDGTRVSYGYLHYELLYNGTIVSHSGFNVDMRDELATKTETFSVGQIEYNRKYTLKVTIEGWLHKLLDYNVGYRVTYLFGGWEFTPSSNRERLLGDCKYTSSSTYYYRDKASLTWDSGGWQQPEGSATVNGAAYDKGSELTGEGRYALTFTNGIDYTSTKYVVIDRTAPEPVITPQSQPTGGIYAGGVRLAYSASANEAPIAAVSYRKKSLSVSENGLVIGETAGNAVSVSNTFTLNESGVYEITARDKCGNESSRTIAVLTSGSNYNLNRSRTTGYLKPENYVVKSPYLKNVTVPTTGKDGKKSKYAGTYSGSMTYVFASKENATEFMREIELQECVITRGNAYVYKAINNPNSTVNYTTPERLNEAIGYYIARYVREYGELALAAGSYIDEKTVEVIDAAAVDDIAKNTGEKELIGGGFVFSRYTVSSGRFSYTNIVTLRIERANGSALYDGAFKAQQKFADYVGTYGGLVRITETDSVGNKTTYYKFYDVTSPAITANFERYNGDEDPISGTLVGDALLDTDRNFKSLKIANVYDEYDAHVYVRVDAPNGETYITHDFASLTFGEGENYSTGGEYSVKVYDRSLNMFEYKFGIAGERPYATSYTEGTGDSKRLIITMKNGADYSSITAFTIYRYDEALPREGRYEESSDGKVMNVINISQTKLTYSFWKGGVYRIKFVDVFNRVTFSDEIVFKKGLPVYVLGGVTEGGETNKAVNLTYKSNIGSTVYQNGEIRYGLTVVTADGYRIDIPAEAVNNGAWTVRLYVRSDEKNYIDVHFVIDTIPPVATATDESGKTLEWSSTVNVPFKIDWDASDSIKRVRTEYNGGYAKTYYRGLVLADDGTYIVSITDTAGNESRYEIALDTTVMYTLTLTGKNYTDAFTGHVYVGGSFLILNKENLEITVRRGDEIVQGRFGTEYATEGEYEITLADDIGNIKIERITIDRTPPSIEYTQADKYAAVTVTMTLSDVKTLKLRFNGKTKAYEFEDETTFTEWGEYEITASDTLGNEAKVTFTIAKRPPVLEVTNERGEALDDGAVINGGFAVDWNDDTATAKIVSSSSSRTYVRNTLITDEGEYTVTVTDEAGNKARVSITVVKTLRLTLITATGATVETIMYGGSERTAKAFTITCSEAVTIAVKKDGEVYEWFPGEMITADGEYEIEATDEAGNVVKRALVLDTTPPVIEVGRDGDEYDAVTVTIESDDAVIVLCVRKAAETTKTVLQNAREYEFSAWGEYEITASDALGNEAKVTFAITKRPPDIFVRTASGRQIKDNELVNENVVIEYDEELTVKYTIAGGYAKVYKLGTILGEQGRYSVSAKDEAGRVYDFAFEIDASIAISLIADNATVKDVSGPVVCKKYFELTAYEELSVTLDFNGAEEDLAETNIRFTEEGYYVFSFSDKAGNESTLAITIDRTPPRAYIDTDPLTRSDVVLSVEDLADVETYKLRIDGVAVNRFVLESRNEFVNEGEYELSLADALGNRAVIGFKIKRKIDVKLDVANGSITSSKVLLTLREAGLKVAAIRNGEALEIVVENNTVVFTDNGSYEVVITDDIGNEKKLTFIIDNAKYHGSLKLKLPLDSTVKLLRNGDEVNADDYIDGDVLEVREDGSYTLTLTVDGVTSSYDFIVDTVQPVLVLNGKKQEAGNVNLGKIRSNFTLATNKSNATLTLYYNGKEAAYTEGRELSAAGKYKVVVRDVLGNESVYEFERVFTLNAGAIALIVLFVLAIAAAALLIVRHRVRAKLT